MEQTSFYKDFSMVCELYCADNFFQALKVTIYHLKKLFMHSCYKPNGLLFLGYPEMPVY